MRKIAFRPASRMRLFRKSARPLCQLLSRLRRSIGPTPCGPLDVGQMLCEDGARVRLDGAPAEPPVQRIAERGILYAPDFVVNAGGIINIAAEHGGYDVDRAAVMVDAIHDNLEEIFQIADHNGVNTEHAAEAMADERIDAARRVKGATP